MTEKHFKVQYDGWRYFHVADTINEICIARLDTKGDAVAYLEIVEGYEELVKENEELNKKNEEMQKELDEIRKEVFNRTMKKVKKGGCEDEDG